LRALHLPVTVLACSGVMEEPVQKSLERYDVLDRIAVGGMAEVFLAKAYGAHGFEKTLAIKRILPELAKDPEFAARFIAEAKVAVRLSHANIVQVFDFGRIGESLFIAMEYVDGLDLAAMLRKFKDEGRQVPLPAAFHIAIEIMRALDFAHGHNVVHRDVSPSNILVSRAGEVKIADFGIAVAASPHRDGGPGPRKVMGKWRYMSPEQARGDTLDTRSDLFSAASVLFELFTSQKLFPGDEAEDIIKNIETMPIPRMSTLRPGLPSRLDDVLAGPLARKPIDRPNRPAVVLRALIELSYESSIMATALDVAEALATVIPAKRVAGRGALDDVIRKQLNDQSTAARRTAVTDGRPPSTETLERNEVSTGLFRKLDLDGLSRLEEVDASTKVAGPRARRSTEVDAPPDRDRRTEIGGPPTGAVPKDLELDAPAGSATARAAPVARGRWIVAGAALALGAGLGVWALTRAERTAAPIVAAPQPVLDAEVAAPVTTGTVEIITTPPGASGTIDGTPFANPTPVRMSNVPSGKHTIRLELPGYQPLDYEIEVRAGQTIVDRQPLARAPAALEVTTDPPGAQVTLGGRVIGTSPIERRDLPSEKGVRLELKRAGYEPLALDVDLPPGELIRIHRTLKAVTRFAPVQIQITPGSSGVGWGDVYAGGRKVGRAPARALRLPVGRVRLHLVNDRATPKVEWDATCQVTETGPNICVVKSP